MNAPIGQIVKFCILILPRPDISTTHQWLIRSLYFSSDIFRDIAPPSPRILREHRSAVHPTINSYGLHKRHNTGTNESLWWEPNHVKMIISIDTLSFDSSLLWHYDSGCAATEFYRENTILPGDCNDNCLFSFILRQWGIFPVQVHNIHRFIWRMIRMIQFWSSVESPNRWMVSGTSFLSIFEYHRWISFTLRGCITDIPKQTTPSRDDWEFLILRVD
jgi:hypothetical protein